MKAPKSECPICFKRITFDQLIISPYIADILAKTQSEKVILNEDGSFTEKSYLEDVFSSILFLGKKYSCTRNHIE